MYERRKEILGLDNILNVFKNIKMLKEYKTLATVLNMCKNAYTLLDSTEIGSSEELINLVLFSKYKNNNIL